MLRDFPEGGQWRCAREMPEHLRKLHRRVQKAAAESRAERVPTYESDLDEDGRAWPGRVEAENRTRSA